MRLITEPADKRKFCDAIVSSFDEIVEDFSCNSIVLTVGTNRNQEVIITQELVKDPKELLKVYRKKSVSI